MTASTGGRRLMTVSQVAEWLALAPETVRQMTRQNQLRAIRIGNGPRAQYRYEPADIELFLAGHKK